MTLRIYEGIPLTQIAHEVGTSVRVIEHYRRCSDGCHNVAPATVRWTGGEYALVCAERGRLIIFSAARRA